MTPLANGNTLIATYTLVNVLLLYTKHDYTWFKGTSEKKKENIEKVKWN